ncbi:hypothetical protein ACGFNQ_35675 [Streptomyces asoensis]|uniref:hypothetical protein n=1 Tax=Streptomyces asoensis TaxID=249586 RepID=UPI0037156629
MSTEDFGSTYLERGWEAPEEVILRRELVRTPGLQPEDLGVLAELLLRDPRLPSTMEAIRGDLQAQGWKMGKDRYNAIAKRLTAAGHLARVSVFDESTQRPTWVTRVFRNPANNTQYVDLGIAASEQVSAESRVSRDPQTPALRETRVSPGQSRKAGNPQSGAESRKTRSLETRVSPGQSRKVGNPRSASSPPHPPVGGGNTSPNPHSSGRAAKWAAACSLTPDDYAPTAEEIKAADAFLQELPGNWQMGVDEARMLAPLLASRVHDLGLELDLLLQLQLVQDDPQNPVRVPARVMPIRIRGLKRRRAGGVSAQAATGGLADWCTKCNRGEFPMAVYQRTVELPDGTDVPCKDCHPKYARA